MTKYPIVLVHGIVLKDFKFYRAFRKIRNYLEKNGVKVFVTNQDGIGSIKSNALQLRDEINNILELTSADKVNIIAHSKGGLDSRYMISMLDMEDKVASLTTLSTPHYGSKMSRKILTMPKFMIKIINFTFNLVYKIFKDKNPNLIRAAIDLTDESMEEFNRVVLNSKKVYYQSYSSDISKKNLFLASIPYRFSKKCEGEITDGIVSISSSIWGDYKGHIVGNYNHFEMVGLYGRKKKMNKIGEFYFNIVKELKEMSL